jgi:plastocyanin
MKNIGFLRSAGLALSAGALLVACSSGSSKTASSTTSPAGASSTAASNGTASSVITIDKFKYTIPATVTPGQKFTVRNEDSVAHTFTSGSAFTVKVAGKGSASFTAPTKAGTYKITCDYHPNMHATMTVAS